MCSVRDPATWDGGDALQGVRTARIACLARLRAIGRISPAEVEEIYAFTCTWKRREQFMDWTPWPNFVRELARAFPGLHVVCPGVGIDWTGPRSGSGVELQCDLLEYALGAARGE
jgi:hypothetical protein